MNPYELGPFTTELKYIDIDVNQVDERSLGISHKKELEILKEFGIQNEVSFSDGKALVTWSAEISAGRDGIDGISIFGIKVALLLQFEIINEDGEVVEEIEKEFEVEPGESEWRLSVSRDGEIPRPKDLSIDLVNKKIKVEF
jgi:hypothetical protein